MEGKKRYIALVLFLLIGLTLFAFANPAEEQKGSTNKNGNGEDTTEVSDKNTDSENDGTLETETNNQNQTQVLNQQPADNTYANALAAVEKAEKELASELANVDSKTLEKLLEDARNLIQQVTSNTSKADLTERTDIVEESLDAIALVAALDELVKESENKEGIEEALDYRTDNQVREIVENLRNGEVQEVLAEILEELNLILDDETDPSYDGIKNNETTKEDVTLTVTDETKVTVTVTLDGEEIEYKEDEAFKEEGIYEILLVDEAFNETKITFTIDKTAPVVTLKGKNKVLEPGHYTYDLYAYIEDASEYTALLNGEAYESGAKISKRDNYTLVVTDKAGNETTIEFAIDKDKPKITGVENGGSYNTAVIPEITDKNLDKITLNGEEFVSGTEVSEEGTYTLVAKDKAGNKTTVTFTIDKTNPEIKVTKSNNDKSTNEDVTVTLKSNEKIKAPEGWTEVIEGYEFTKVYSENGKHTLVVEDLAGNKTTVKFEVKRIDKVAPTATVKKSNNDQPINQDVIVTITSNEAIYKPSGWTEVNSNKEHEFTKVYSENGEYEVVITDKAGNKTTVKFEVIGIDKVAPTGTVTTSNKNGSQPTNQDVTATLKTDEKIVTPSGWTEVTEGYEFTKVYSENTKVTLQITDLAGNTGKVKFEVKRIDKIAPVVTVIDPNKYQLEVHSEYVDKGYSAYDKVDKDVTNRIKITYQFQAKGTNNWPFVDELDTSKLGTYKIIYTATDKAGNSAKGTRVVEIVDTTAPLLTLNGEKEITLEAGIETYQEFGVKVTDNYDATIEAHQPKMINFTAPDGTKETWLSEVDTNRIGQYKIQYEYTDSSNNKGLDANDPRHTYVIRIVNVVDTTAPLLTLNGESKIILEAGIDAYEELGATATDNYDETANVSVDYINYTDKDGNFVGKVATVDNTKLGTYKIVYTHTDSNGNIGVDASRKDHEYIIRTVVVQDTINPTLAVKQNSLGNDPYFREVNFALSDSNKIDYFEVNGTKFDRSDAKYSDANYQNIKSAVVAGENTIVLYDTAGNKTEKTFYMDWTSPTITVKQWYGQDPYRGADFSLSDNYVIDYFEVNGTKYDRTNSKYSDANYQNIKSSLVNGENILVLYDAAGNSQKYTFTLERIAPTITVSAGTEGTGPYKKLNLKLYDASGIASVAINGKQLTHTGYYVDINDGHAYTFVEGTNIVSVTDKAGNNSTQTFVVDRNTYVSTVEELKELLKTTDKIGLSNDLELTESLIIPSGRNVRLDLNGKTISGYSTTSAASNLIIVENGSTLTLKGNGTITFTAGNPDTDWGSDGPKPFPGYANNTIKNSGKLIIDGPTIINNTARGGASYVIDNYPGADLIINSGKIHQAGGDQAIRLFANSATVPTNVTVNGGTIIGRRAIWIQLPSSNSSVAPIVNVKINGGTLSTTETDGLAIYSYSYGNSFANTTVTFNGGTFNGDVQFGGGYKGDTETVILNGGIFNNFLGRWTTDGWVDIEKPAQ